MGNFKRRESAEILGERLREGVSPALRFVGGFQGDPYGDSAGEKSPRKVCCHCRCAHVPLQLAESGKPRASDGSIIAASAKLRIPLTSQEKNKRSSNDQNPKDAPKMNTSPFLNLLKSPGNNNTMSSSDRPLSKPKGGNKQNKNKYYSTFGSMCFHTPNNPRRKKRSFRGPKARCLRAAHPP